MPTDHRTVEPGLGDDLPALPVGTFEFHGVTFLRADHLCSWLDDVVFHDPPIVVGEPAELIREIRCMIAEAGGVK
jgi:hypothetical protein